MRWLLGTTQSALTSKAIGAALTVEEASDMIDRGRLLDSVVGMIGQPGSLVVSEEVLLATIAPLRSPEVAKMTAAMGAVFVGLDEDAHTDFLQWTRS